MSERESCKHKGKAGEDAAVKYLVEHGWRIVSRNWRNRRGELDIIALDPVDTLVAIEVKSWWGRNSEWSADDMAYAVPPYKLVKMRRCFADFLACHPQLLYHSYRFDAICIRNGSVSHFQGV
ncbi:MAG: YraN family protein [Sphaerochaetaceae bacterium]|jgi:putative endonuclease